MNELDTRNPASAYGPRREPTETERVVLRVWREVFELDDVSLDDDVLDLGVSSLAAVEMCLRVERLVGVEVTAASLLETSTVSGLAALIDKKRAR